MARAKPLPLTVAPSPACSLLLGGHVIVAGVNGETASGLVSRSIAVGGPMLILHQDGHSVGCVEFEQDFDHIRVRGSTESFSLKDVILIEIP